MKVSMILGVDLNGLIGKSDNSLPWHIREDMSWFKNYTTDKAVLMGKNTWEGINRPLPNRTNMVISKTTAVDGTGNVLTVDSFNKAVNLAKFFGRKELVIMGGKALYESLGVQMADKVVLTVIEGTYEGDVRVDIPLVNAVLEKVRTYRDTLTLPELEAIQISQKSEWGITYFERIDSVAGVKVNFIVFEKNEARNF